MFVCMQTITPTAELCRLVNINIHCRPRIPSFLDYYYFSPCVHSIVSFYNFFSPQLFLVMLWLLVSPIAAAAAVGGAHPLSLSLCKRITRDFDCVRMSRRCESVSDAKQQKLRNKLPFILLIKKSGRINDEKNRGINMCVCGRLVIKSEAMPVWNWCKAESVCARPLSASEWCSVYLYIKKIAKLRCALCMLKCLFAMASVVMADAFSKSGALHCYRYYCAILV